MSKTQLKDRTLYYDGDTEVSPDHVIDLIDKGLRDIYVSEMTDDIKQYNRLGSNKINTKEDVRPLSFEWNIPEKYKNLDVVEYVIDRWANECALDSNISSEDADVRAKRVSDELHLYKELNLFPVLRTIIYVINTLQDNKIVWGVGRGSSVSSYVLYLLGVHDVDSVKYDLNINDFLRRPNQEIKDAKESPIS